MSENQVGYAPNMDGDPDPGEVVWGWIPYEDDPTQGKDRPCVVLAKRDENVLAVPLTSKHDEDREDEWYVGPGPWDKEGRPSWAKIDDVQVLPVADVRREGAALDKERFDALVDACGDYAKEHPEEYRS